MSLDLGLLIIRLAVGGLVAGHGAQKMFGWFGGNGFVATRTMMGSHLRMRPAALWTALAGLSEFGGGVLLMTGLLSPLGSLGIIAAMLVAITIHWPQFWAMRGGFEYPLALLTMGLSSGLAGPGRYSLDRALGIALPAPTTFLVGLILVLGGVLLALATRTPRVTETAPSEATARS